MQWLKDIALLILLILIGATVFLAAVAFIPPKVTPSSALGFERHGIEQLKRGYAQ